MKTLSASTSSLLIGIIKHELAAELVLHEVHLSAHHCHQCFAIDDHLKMVFADNFIEFAGFFSIVHGIGKPVASFFGQTDFDADLGRTYELQLMDPSFGSREQRSFVRLRVSKSCECVTMLRNYFLAWATAVFKTFLIIFN